MKKQRQLIAAALLIVASMASSFAQQCGLPYSQREVVLMSTLGNPPNAAEIAAGENGGINLNDGVVLTPDKMYILDAKCYVKDGRKLTILPGVVIKGRYVEGGENANALIVCRGGKIYATGTSECPIIFTAEDDQLNGEYPVTNKERWGGVILMGKARNTVKDGDQNPENPGVPLGVSDGIGFIEGLPWPDPRHWYGMAYDASASPVVLNFDDDDNSGILSYVSIRHGGSEIGTANEINGLTCGSVGRGTTLDHIEIISNGDDGIEFFGGTVDIKYAVIKFCEDDYIDWDQGYIGNGQYIFGVALPTTAGDVAEAYSDNGLEMDGDDFNRPTWPVPNSDPKFCNITMLGRGSDVAFELKARTKGTLWNSVMTNYATGANFASVTTPINVDCNTFVNCGTFAAGSTSSNTPGWPASNLNVASLAGFDPIWQMQVTLSPEDNTVLDVYDAVPNDGEVNTTCDCSTLGSFFDATNYRGAFKPGEKPWTGWSYNTVLGTDFNVKFDVRSDINQDGITNTTDLLRVTGRWRKTNDQP